MTQEFSTAIDIANRACQHMGARRIVAFTDDSVQAVEIGGCYDQLRRAELERNVWVFATRRVILRPLDTNTMLLTPEQWSSTKNYFNGAIVDDGTGTYWTNVLSSNLNNQPGVSNTWKAYFGSLAVHAFDPTTNYFTGELVYQTDGAGNFYVYVARVSITQNPTGATQTVVQTVAGVTTITTVQQSGPGSDAPNQGSQWSATQQYQKNAIVQQNGFWYMSLIDGNLNNSPGTGVDGNSTFALWNANTAYSANAIVASYVDGKIYRAFVGSTGVEPSSDLTGATWRQTGQLNPWTSAFSAGLGSNDWLRLAATLGDLNVNYPIGTGPVSQSDTRNAFALPYGYVRRAPSDPKAGSSQFLGAPSGLSYTDHVLEGGYIVSRDAGPIMLRFVANIRNVVDMDPMFCEALGCRIGMETCERVTSSTAKISVISAEYKKFLGEAIIINGIETEAVEAAVDDYLTCRL